MNNPETFRVVSKAISSEDKDNRSSRSSSCGGGGLSSEESSGKTKVGTTISSKSDSIATTRATPATDVDSGGAFATDDDDRDGRKPLLLSPVKAANNKGKKANASNDGGTNNDTPREEERVEVTRSSKKKNTINYTRESKSQSTPHSPSSSSSYPLASSLVNPFPFYSFAVVLLRFFILVSVSSLLLGSLFWFHVRLTSLEEQVRAIYSQTDKVTRRLQPAERNNAHESQQASFERQQGSSHHSYQFDSDSPTFTSRLSLEGDEHDTNNGRVMSHTFQPDSQSTTTTRYWSSASDDVKPSSRVSISFFGIA